MSLTPIKICTRALFISAFLFLYSSCSTHEHSSGDGESSKTGLHLHGDGRFSDVGAHGPMTKVSTIQAFRNHYPETKVPYLNISDQDVIVYASALSEIFLQRSHHHRRARQISKSALESVALITGTNNILNLSKNELAFLAGGVGAAGILNGIWHPEKHPQIFYEASRRMKQSVMEYYRFNSTPSEIHLTENGRALLDQVDRHFDAAYVSAYYDQLPDQPTVEELEKEAIAKDGLGIVGTKSASSGNGSSDSEERSDLDEHGDPTDPPRA